MEKIELTKEEVQSVLNTLGEIPFKFSVGLINFFQTKLQQPKESAVSEAEVMK